MAFFIHKRLRNLSYVRHNRLTFYNLRRTTSNFSASNFNDYVSNVMVVRKKTHFCTVAISSLIHYCVISSWINGRSYYVVFLMSVRGFPSKEKWYYMIQAKLRSRTLRCIWCKCKWQKRHVTSRRVFTHHCSDTEGLRYYLHFLKVILWTYFDI